MAEDDAFDSALNAYLKDQTASSPLVADGTLIVDSSIGKAFDEGRAAGLQALADTCPYLSEQEPAQFEAWTEGYWSASLGE